MHVWQIGLTHLHVHHDKVCGSHEGPRINVHCHFRMQKRGGSGRAGSRLFPCRGRRWYDPLATTADYETSTEQVLGVD